MLLETPSCKMSHTDQSHIRSTIGNEPRFLHVAKYPDQYRFYYMLAWKELPNPAAVVVYLPPNIEALDIHSKRRHKILEGVSAGLSHSVYCLIHNSYPQIIFFTWPATT